jgi:hypothetical protein
MYRRVFKLTTRRNIPEDSKLKSWLNSSWLFSVSAGKCQNITLKLGHDRFVPNPLQFIFHLSHFCLMVYSLSNWGSVVEKLQAEAHTKNVIYAPTAITFCTCIPQSVLVKLHPVTPNADSGGSRYVHKWTRCSVFFCGDRIISRDLWFWDLDPPYLFLGTYWRDRCARTVITLQRKYFLVIGAWIRRLESLCLVLSRGLPYVSMTSC